MKKLFFRHEKPGCGYDPERQVPAIRVSICTGEKTAGFVDKATQRFTADHLIASKRELDEFCRACGTTPQDIREIY